MAREIYREKHGPSDDGEAFYHVMFNITVIEEYFD